MFIGQFEMGTASTKQKNMKMKYCIILLPIPPQTYRTKIDKIGE